MTEPEKVMMPRYRCVHCRRSWANRATARDHAGRCWYDPANRGCKTCAHFTHGWSEEGTGWVQEDSCAAGLQLPVVERFEGLRPSLAVHCPSHRLSEHYAHPDLLDITAASDAA